MAIKKYLQKNNNLEKSNSKYGYGLEKATQSQHTRTSKTGKVFMAGEGSKQEKYTNTLKTTDFDAKDFADDIYDNFKDLKKISGRADMYDGNFMIELNDGSIINGEYEIDPMGTDDSKQYYIVRIKDANDNEKLYEFDGSDVNDALLELDQGFGGLERKMYDRFKKETLKLDPKKIDEAKQSTKEVKEVFENDVDKEENIDAVLSKLNNEDWDGTHYHAMYILNRTVNPIFNKKVYEKHIKSNMDKPEKLKEETYSWDHINNALTKMGMPSKRIADILIAIKKG